MNKIISESSDTVIRHKHEVLIDNKKYFYIAYVDEENYAVDCIIRDKDGNNVDDPIILEQIEELI